MFSARPLVNRVMSIAKPRLAIGLLALALLGVLAARKGPNLVHVYYHNGLRLVTVATGLQTPWSLVFLPDGRLLVSERTGHLRLLAANGHGAPGVRVSGLPPIWENGGPLGVTLDPDYAHNHLIYWSYMDPAPGGKGASLCVARAALEGTRLERLQIILRDPQVATSAAGFGSRLVFAADGRLLVTLGDRDQRDDAQRLDSLHGKIVRIEADGRIPNDNPFVRVAGANPAIWALGFRDPQGIAVQPGSHQVWSSDHGPLGGDEINLIRGGHNYGWPIVTYGVQEGTGAKIGIGTEAPGMDPAVLWWHDAVPPAGMTFLTSERYPGWKDQLFVGTLWGQALVRIKLDGERVVEQEKIYAGSFGRVRDVEQGPDGWLYLVVNEPEGAIIRLER